MKSTPSSKFWAAIFRLIGAAAAASVLDVGQWKDAGPAEACSRKHRGGRTLRWWAPGLCAALLLLSWPMRGYSQTGVATIGAGTNPFAAAVNPVTNKIYVTNKGSNNVTVIDGATNTTTTVAAGTTPAGVAVNPVTNKIYVANAFNNNVTVIDGNVTVIDGATNTTTTVAAGVDPGAVAVNPVTNKIYVANMNNFSSSSSDVTVLTEQQVPPIPLTTAISTLPNNQTTNARPSFTFTASSTFSPTAPPVDAVYFQVDTWQGPWTAATATMTPGSFTTKLPTLSLGIHILYAYATDGQDASSIMTTDGNGGGSSPVLGNIAAYLFLVNKIIITSANSTSFQVGAFGTFTVNTTGLPTPSITESGPLPAGVTFLDNGNGTGTLSGTPTATGTLTFPITFTAQNGVSPNATQSFTLTVNQAPAITSANATSFQVGAAGTFSVTTIGSPPPSITESGPLPAGVTFLDNGKGTGTLSGTPTASGTF